MVYSRYRGQTFETIEIVAAIEESARELGIHDQFKITVWQGVGTVYM